MFPLKNLLTSHPTQNKIPYPYYIMQGLKLFLKITSHSLIPLTCYFSNKPNMALLQIICTLTVLSSWNALLLDFSRYKCNSLPHSSGFLLKHFHSTETFLTTFCLLPCLIFLHSSHFYSCFFIFSSTRF